MDDPLVEGSESYLARPDDGAYPHVSEAEAKRMSAKAPDRKKQLLFKLLWGTGARVSEVLALTPADFDFDEAIVHLERLKRKEEFIQELPLDRELVNEVRLFVSERDIPTDQPVIDVHRTTAYRWCKQIGKQALNRKDIGPHHFRHGRVYAMLRDGVHPLVISRALGHASVSSVMSYVHPDAEDIRKALS